MIDNDVFCETHSLFQCVRSPKQRQSRPFGGGGSGLGKVTEEQFARIFSWMYMGDAEFEFGTCATCIIYMNDHRKDLVKSEDNGFFFLLLKEIEDKAHKLWQRVVNKEFTRHNPRVDNAEVLGWFDFKNGFFVSRTAELRDALHHLLLNDDE